MMMVPGIDGLMPFAELPPSGCCPPDPCTVTAESVACNFINLLPSGPLWDEAKLRGISCGGWCTTACRTEDCGHMVNYAAFTGRRLHAMLQENLWPSLREANIYTAYETLDEWLDRLRWRDCYMSTCRVQDEAGLMPYEVLGPQGPRYCPPTFTPELAILYKRGVAIALQRMRLKPVRNIAAINFIFEYLHTTVSYERRGAGYCLIVAPNADQAEEFLMPKCPRDEDAAQKMVTLFLSPGNGLCAGGPSRVYPMTLAAFCIVKALLPTCDTVCIARKP